MHSPRLHSFFVHTFILLLLFHRIIRRQARYSLSNFAMKFAQIVLAASAATVAFAYPRGKDVDTTKQSADVQKRANGFTWFGVSESGAEFGESNIPGTLGSDYAWPDNSQVKILRDQGMNVFRVPFLMERMVPTGLTGPLDATYLAGLTSVRGISTVGIDPLLSSNNSAW